MKQLHKRFTDKQ